MLKAKEEQDLEGELSYLGLIGPMKNSISLSSKKQSAQKNKADAVLKMTVEVVQIGKLHAHWVTLALDALCATQVPIPKIIMMKSVKYATTCPKKQREKLSILVSLYRKIGLIAITPVMIQRLHEWSLIPNAWKITRCS